MSIYKVYVVYNFACYFLYRYISWLCVCVCACTNVQYVYYTIIDIIYIVYVYKKKCYSWLFQTGYLYFWGIVYIVAAACVSKFKSEIQPSAEQKGLGVLNTYKLLWDIIKLPNVKILGAIFLTGKVSEEHLLIYYLILFTRIIDSCTVYTAVSF